MHTTMQNHEAVVKAVVVDGIKLNHPHHIAFVRACRAANHKPKLYEGRLCYVGPAIDVSGFSDVSCLGIDMPLDWDHLAKGFVVHPRVSANECEDRRIDALRWHDRVMRG